MRQFSDVAASLIIEQAPPPKKADQALALVNNIKKRFQHDKDVIKSFFEILKMYRNDDKDITETYTLLIQSQAQRYDDPGSAPPPVVPQVLIENDRQADTAVASPGDRDHSADCSDLIVDKVMHIELRERVEKENGERRSRDVDEGGDVGINYQERRINALSYVKDVKQMFQDQRD
ncbi:hypothetical protein YC2023_123750 [Brassica napus]